MSSKFTVNIAIIVLVLLIIYFGYSLFTSGGSETATPAVTTEEVDDTLADSASATPVPVVDIDVPAQPSSTVTSGVDAAAEFVRVLSSLQNVTLNGDIFQNETFKNRLQDFSRPLPLRFAGRVNPFAPFGSADLVGIPNAASLIDSNNGTTTQSVPSRR